MSADNQELIDFLETLKGTSSFENEDLAELVDYLGGAEELDLPPELLADEDAEPDTKDVRTLIGRMSIPQKLKTAMFGNASCRAILINDGNRLIQMAVLKNPKIQEKDIADFAKSTNISKNILRAISNNRQWSKPYSVKLNLVCNPKSPIDIAIKWLRFINLSDMKKIARSKNIPTAVVTQAKKRLELAQKKK